MSACSRECSIFNIPDEILLEILLYLNINERAWLADVLKKFDVLVLMDKRFLRDLDFSENGRLTTAAYVEPYFSNSNAGKHIRKVNLCNVTCMDTGYLFNNFISKASNLVDINIHGIKLEDLQQLASLLKPLIFVRRLSIDWPAKENKYRDEILEIIGDPFGRLEYLSVKVIGEGCYGSFLRSSAVCQELKALRLHCHEAGSGYCLVRRKLANLESLEYYRNDVQDHYRNIIQLLLNEVDWVEVLLPEPIARRYLYLVKAPEINEELGNGILRQHFDRHIRIFEGRHLLDSYLRMDRILKAVIRITNTGVPENFFSKLDPFVPCALRIEDAKLLLKNPRHRIKYLYLGGSIGTKCENHFYSLACPSVTELYLSGSSEIDTWTSKTTGAQGQHFTGPSDSEPCFRMLVENTPLVTNLTLNGNSRVGDYSVRTWDIGPLSLIQGWRNLRSLRLLWLRIHDGAFLIDIGKQCKYLEKLEFYEIIGPNDACCYAKELSVMLSHCPNLADFSIRADNFGKVSELLDSLANNSRLRRVRFKSLGQKNNTTNLIPAMEQLLRRCSRLTTFLCIIDGISQADSDQLASALRRLRTELNRPNLDFNVTRSSSSNVASHVQDTISEDSRLPCFPDIWQECDYQ